MIAGHISRTIRVRGKNFWGSGMRVHDRLALDSKGHSLHPLNPTTPSPTPPPRPPLQPQLEISANTQPMQSHAPQSMYASELETGIGLPSSRRESRRASRRESGDAALRLKDFIDPYLSNTQKVRRRASVCGGCSDRALDSHHWFHLAEAPVLVQFSRRR